MQWNDVVAWAQSQLDQARIKNDGDVDASGTATLRGRIALLKELIALPDTNRLMKAQSKYVEPFENGASQY